MEEDLILHQPADRRLENVNTLPLGPPGTEFDPVEPEPPKETEKLNGSKNYEEKRSSTKQSRFSSPVLQSKRKSPSRSRRSPTPERRRRRSSSPRRYGYSSYGSSDRRRYDNNRQHRRRSPPPRDWRDRRDRDRFYRGGRPRSDSRSRSRSSSPRQSGAKKNWSPARNASSPNLGNIQAVPPPNIVQPPQSQNQAYRMMPSQMYGDSYGQVSYNQYDMQHNQPNFVQQNNSYSVPANIAPTFNPSYPPPSSWDGYSQQAWMSTALPNPPQIHSVHVPGGIPQIIPPQTTMNVLPDAAPGTVEVNSTHDAVAQEAENQRDELKKQRTSYLEKTVVLKKELRILKEQRKELNSTSAPPSPTTQGFIDENENLQLQIERKLSTIENVIDMLTGIIGEENLDKDVGDQIEADTSKEVDEILDESLKNKEERSKKRSVSSDSSSGTSSSSSSSTCSDSSSEHDDSSPERLKNKVLESMKAKQREAVIKKLKDDKKVDQINVEATECYNYVFYDPEMHWCQTCDIFPKTAKDYLNHLHTKEHMDRESIDTPWHLDMVNDQYPTFENAPTKRTPIRGLTFFVPATAWFCKLCSIWMGDLHCASTHLKSKTHSSKYLSFLEKNPHHEVNWLADRQRVLNEKRATPLPPQITSISTTATEVSNSKQDTGESKSQKKRKRKSRSDKKSKKKKREKKSKKGANVSSGSSSGSGSSSENEDKYSKKKKSIDVKNLSNQIPASSIRVAMRNQIKVKDEKSMDVSPPPPPKIAASSKETLDEKPKVQPEKPKDDPRQADVKEKDKPDDVILRQWNSVQPVISDSEKKLLEQLKDKLKGKPQEESDLAVSTKNITNSENLEREYRERKRRSTSRRRAFSPRRRRSRSTSYGRNRSGRLIFRRARRSRSRSKGWYGRRRGRSRTRSRTYSRSRSRSLRRRSRSYDRRRYTRSRSKSGSRNRIEKPIVKHPEFRPRVPEKEKEKTQKKSTDMKEKKVIEKKQKSQTSAGKKLPFIGKMPVFKKQTSGQSEGSDRKNEEFGNEMSAQFMLPTPRPPAPTAAQINMAMMEDVYGNAPPFHPDAGMMVDYDDLMPDPVQFVNIMGQAPPPPPSQTADKSDEDDTEDVLPPGIDEIETDEFVTKPVEDDDTTDKNQLPKDLEEALNIIFPGEKKAEDMDEKNKVPAGETQIIVEKPVMQVEDLVKEGIHLVSIQQTNAACLQETAELSMNEPLNFNNQMVLPPVTSQDIESSTNYAVQLDDLPLPNADKGTSSEYKEEQMESSEMDIVAVPVPAPNDIPMPAEETNDVNSAIYDLDDIPEPTNTSKEVERSRRQEELDDLAMLGIDADDMAAQCM